MATLAELLRDVLSSPDDDAPRLAYAAHCDTEADAATRARGAFIRAEIELLSVDAEAEPARSFRLKCAIRDLAEAHEKAWVADVLAFAREPRFDRGFVGLVSLDTRDFLQNAGQLFALSPIRHLDLTGAAGEAKALFASPHLAGVRSLRLDRSGLTDDHIELLAASPHLGELRWLSIAQNEVTMKGADAMAASKGLPRLRYVRFHGNEVDPGERQGHDQGVVVDAWLPDDGVALEQKYGHIPWLHTNAKTLMDVVPDRFRIG